MEMLNYIGGSWQPSADGAISEVINPATGLPLATVPVSTKADVDAAVHLGRSHWIRRGNVCTSCRLGRNTIMFHG